MSSSPTLSVVRGDGVRRSALCFVGGYNNVHNSPQCDSVNRTTKLPLTGIGTLRRAPKGCGMTVGSLGSKNPSETELLQEDRIVRDRLTQILNMPDGDFHVRVDLVCGGDPVVALPDG